MARAWFSVIAMLAVLAISRPAAALDDAQINADVAALSDPDANVREKATAELWTAGKAAEPALRKALQSDDPEVARRASAILMRFELGIFPDTPAQIIELIQQYQSSPVAGRPRIVSLLADQGNRGLRVLMALRNRERDLSLRKRILDAIGSKPHEREGAALMIAYGDVAGATEVLRTGSLDSKSSARDLAALLIVRGGLNDEIAAGKTDSRTRTESLAATRQAFLARAAGDFKLAADAAKDADEPHLLDSILIEAGDWKRLASRYTARNATSSDTLGFGAAFCRFAGDIGGLDAQATALQMFADHHEDGYLHCAECLMLNDRIDEGIAVLLSHRDYAAASEFLLLRLQFAQLLDLEKRIDARISPADAMHLRTRMVWAFHFIGDNDSALKRIEDVARANRRTNDLATWYLLVDAAHELNKQDLADEYLAAALMLPAVGDGTAAIEKANLPDGFPGAFWWRFMRYDTPNEPYVQTLARLRQFANGKMSQDQIDLLTKAAERSAQGRSAIDRELMMMPIAHTLIHLKKAKEAEDLLNRLISGTASVGALQLLGDCQATQGGYAKAAATYERAWGMDQTRAVPLALKGWALAKSGAAAQGRQAIELAHLLPLSDETQRSALQDLFARHELPEDARRERDLICKTGPFLSWDVCNAMRLNGDDRLAQGDPLGAADAWERAFLGNFQSNMSFVEPWANVMTPAMIHKARATGLIKTSPSVALAEAQAAMKDSPGDANVLIDLVQAFEQTGHKSEADAIYVTCTAIYQRLCDEYPKSGAAQNQIAWVQARCKRDLDQAVMHAQRAVELEPTDTASMDTLAEAYFVRGEFQKAIDQMQKCAELEPDVARHREQIARFKAAMTAGKK